MKLFLLSAFAICMVLCLSVHAQAQEVLAGVDLLETDPSNTTWDLGNLQSLCPGCSVVGDTIIPLQGVPFGFSPVCPGEDLGSADTIVRRLSDTVGLPVGPAPIQIEIIELQLQSVQPFQVDCQGNLELWVLDVTLEPVPPAPGQMTIFRFDANGGTFQTDVLPVRPLLTFTRVDSGPPVVVCEVNVPQINFNGGGAPWTYLPQPGAVDIPGCTSNFFPGLNPGPPPVSGLLVNNALPAYVLTGGPMVWGLSGAQGGTVPVEETTWGRLKELYQD